MDKTELLLQAEKETFLASSFTSGKSESKANLLLDLETCRRYISKLVTSYISRTSPDLISSEERTAVIKDVTQNAWIKLLFRKKSANTKIFSPKSYIPYIVRSEAIDEIRRRKCKPTVSLPLDQDGEVMQGKILLPVQQGMRDPTIEYELKELIVEIIDEVVQLPPRQRYAMICVLKDEVGIIPLTEIFGEHGIDILPITWPQDPKELQRLRSLLSEAHRTLREKFNRSTGITQS